MAIAILLALLILGVNIGNVWADGPTKINYRLKWLFNCSTIGDNWADVKGLFAQNGLDVTVKAGGPERDAIKELELGYAQFGVASADQVLRARTKGAKVIVIAQLFQTNPLQWIYRPENGTIKRLADLKGKTLGITFGGNDESIMRTLLAKANLTENDVKLFSVRYDYTPFYQRKVDLWPVYRNTQAVFIGDKLEKAGEKVDFFIPGSYGVKFVANSVVTSERMLKQNPQTVTRFLGALMKGWRQALDPTNQNEALAVLARFDKDNKSDVLKRQLDVTRSLIKPDKNTKIGAIDIQAWKMTADLMLKQNQISKPVDIEKALKPFPDLY
jgi:NitT/TauT family transport system substrate-binding protein